MELASVPLSSYYAVSARKRPTAAASRSFYPSLPIPKISSSFFVSKFRGILILLLTFSLIIYIFWLVSAKYTIQNPPYMLWMGRIKVQYFTGVSLTISSSIQRQRSIIFFFNIFIRLYDFIQCHRAFSGRPLPVRQFASMGCSCEQRRFCTVLVLFIAIN